MYVTPGALFLIGIVVGVVATFGTIVCVALYVDSKFKKGEK